MLFSKKRAKQTAASFTILIEENHNVYDGQNTHVHHTKRIKLPLIVSVNASNLKVKISDFHENFKKIKLM